MRRKQPHPSYGYESPAIILDDGGVVKGTFVSKNPAAPLRRIGKWWTFGPSRSDSDGLHVGICTGYPVPTKRGQASQSIQVTFGEIAKKVSESQELIEKFRQKFADTGLFVAAGSGRDLRYWISKRPAEHQIRAIVGLLRSLAEEVKALSKSDTT